MLAGIAGDFFWRCSRFHGLAEAVGHAQCVRLLAAVVRGLQSQYLCLLAAFKGDKRDFFIAIFGEQGANHLFQRAEGVHQRVEHGPYYFDCNLGIRMLLGPITQGKGQQLRHMPPVARHQIISLAMRRGHNRLPVVQAALE